MFKMVLTNLTVESLKLSVWILTVLRRNSQLCVTLMS